MSIPYSPSAWCADMHLRMLARRKGPYVDALQLAVVGATGAVGREILLLLNRIGLLNARVLPAATAASAGMDLGAELGLTLPVESVRAIEDVDFGQIDVAFFTAGAEVSRQHAEKAADGGCLVIDNSSAFRARDDVPLIIPQVNPCLLAQRPASGLISNPNCSTIQLVRVLHPLCELAGLERVILSTYQAASGGGLRGLDELASGSASVLDDGQPPPCGRFGPPLAFNLVPQIGMADESATSNEEHKLATEPLKIMDMPDLKVSATAVRVPIFHCHAEAVWVRFDRPVSAADAAEVLRSTRGILLYAGSDSPPYPTPRLVERSGLGRAWVHVGRVRVDPADPTALWLWIVADNLWVGAALNAVNILQTVLKYGWLA